MMLDVSWLSEDDGSGRTYGLWLLDAWRWTLVVSFLSWCVALLLGTLMGSLRTLPHSAFWAGVGRAWVEVFRNIPVLVQIFLWYFVVPQFIPAMKQWPSLLTVVLALGLFTSARIAEQIRAGIMALPRGQRMAAQALGLNTWQTYRYVIWPMAFRLVWPPLTSEAMNLLKNSSVAFAVSIAELTLYAMQVQEETSRGIEVYLLVTVFYFVSALVVNRLMVWAESRWRIPGFAGGANLSGGH